MKPDYSTGSRYMKKMWKEQKRISKLSPEDREAEAKAAFSSLNNLPRKQGAWFARLFGSK